MRVALANSCRFLGGAEFWQIRFARFLQGRGDELKFFIRPGKFSELVGSEKFPAATIKMSSDLDALSVFRFYFALKDFGPEIILFNDQRDLRLGVLAAQMASVPLKVQRKGWSYLKGSFRDRFYYRRLDYVACLSDYIEKLFTQKLGMDKSRLYHLPNGVELERFCGADGAALRQSLGIGHSEIVIGMAGRLERQKRQADLLRAAKVLIERGVKLRVLFAGEGRERGALESLAGKLGLAGRAHFLGFVDKIGDFLRSLDIFAFCSEWEGMPNAVLEAMACGAPVVAANIPGVKEIVAHEKTGLLYPAGDVNALASRIERLVGDRPFAEQLGKNAALAIEENFNERKIFMGFRDWLEDRLEAKR